MAAPNQRWRLATVATEGSDVTVPRFAPEILTVWRQPPNSRVWLAHIRWGEDQQWGWFIYDPATIIRVPEPATAAPPLQF